eukprot:COSAG06_NODE_1619_length_8908_cov_3.222727_2_plen_229_part_00
MFRETLMGGYYEIVNKTSYLPNPDSFTMALFSRLMGPKVLHATVHVSTATTTVNSMDAGADVGGKGEGAPANATEMLRGYAHCARTSTSGTGGGDDDSSGNSGGGQATVLLINLASTTAFTVTIDTPAPTSTTVGGGAGVGGGEWHLTAPLGDIHAKAIELNGKLLTLINNNTEMPPMPPKPSATLTASSGGGGGGNGNRRAGGGGGVQVEVGPASVVFVQVPMAACA